jgi:serine/threonine protein kinase
MQGSIEMAEHPPTRDGSATVGPASGGLPAIPGYEILAELGRGGMGVVYQARHSGVQGLVALKLIRDSALSGAHERARFRIEAEAAARMRHPNIVRIHEVGEHAGQPYFAMEFVDGGSLDQLLAGKPQPALHAAALVRTLALAIEHAHAQKIVHRDLKPANILLAAGPSEGTADARTTLASPISMLQPKITDFGLAKRLDSDSTALTQDGAVLGTPSYMAPEQAAGRVSEIGPAVDIYALGAILYELLTGRPPFQADSWNQTVQQVLHDDPLPPSRWQPGVPADLETICLKCLEKEPAERYSSAQKLADDLGRFQEARPILAVPLGERERLARLARRDGYEILGEIGRGPRSIVFHARSTSLNQAVALKVFDAGICPREEWDARLRRATDLWAGLSHPNITLVHRAGWWDSSPYLAAEFVPQGSLAAKLAGQMYPLRQALRLVEQLAEIVSYLHRQGVVHGNLKPGNVLLAADDIPQIVDFHVVGGWFVGGQTGEGSTGLGYLAPEFITAPLEEPRFYTDVYGLGAILYELLTGRPPFVATSAEEMLAQVRSREPVPPSQLNTDVPHHVESLCLRCLRKNPWSRYHRAYDMLTRLRSFQEDRANLVGPARPYTSV